MNNSLNDLKYLRNQRNINIIKHLNLLNLVYYKDEIDLNLSVYFIFNILYI